MQPLSGTRSNSFSLSAPNLVPSLPVQSVLDLQKEFQLIEIQAQLDKVTVEIEKCQQAIQKFDLENNLNLNQSFLNTTKTTIQLKLEKKISNKIKLEQDQLIYQEDQKKTVSEKINLEEKIKKNWKFDIVKIKDAYPLLLKFLSIFINFKDELETWKRKQELELINDNLNETIQTIQKQLNKKIKNIDTLQSDIRLKETAQIQCKQDRKKQSQEKHLEDLNLNTEKAKLECRLAFQKEKFNYFQLTRPNEIRFPTNRTKFNEMTMPDIEDFHSSLKSSSESINEAFKKLKKAHQELSIFDN